MPTLLPQILSVTTFVAGVILIVSALLPRCRVELRHSIPCSLWESSSSRTSRGLAGAGLIILAWAIRRRLVPPTLLRSPRS